MLFDEGPEDLNEDVKEADVVFGTGAISNAIQYSDCTENVDKVSLIQF